MHLPAESYDRMGSTRPNPLRPLIFVVEDDGDIARLVSHNLQSAGFAVQSFVSGASVLTEAARELPDVMLPGTDGF
jgi:two-component system phosphate regulon response regulator PhoB